MLEYVIACTYLPRYFNSQMFDVSLHTKATIIACCLIIRIDFSPQYPNFLLNKAQLSRNPPIMLYHQNDGVSGISDISAEGGL